MRSQFVSPEMFEPVRSYGFRPLRTLMLLTAGALVMLGLLVGPAARSGAVPGTSWRPLLAPADTDSVRIDTGPLEETMPASPAADTLSAQADTLTFPDSVAVADTNYRAQRYLPGFLDDSWSASLLPRRRRPLAPGLGSYWRHDVVLDSTGVYVVREMVGETDVRFPIALDRDTYRRVRLDASLERNWHSLIEMRARQQAQRRGGIGVNITVPGGRQSAFTTIFGKNEVDLRVTGQADIKAGFDYQKSDQQIALGRGSQVNPDFKQDLRLGVTGTIGDKMRVDVNWDTERDFDYQNQLKLQYTGYEDEILQNIEAGNVFLQTPSSLIRGGQSLFGIKAELQVGGVRLTTVASQQEGQANSISLEGGAQEEEFDIKPTEYDERQHFFLAYYFRNRWEEAFSQPERGIIVDSRFDYITDVEVWKLQGVSREEQNIRNVVAVVDLGEPADVVTLANEYAGTQLPSEEIDQYSSEDVANYLRPGSTADPTTFLEDPSLMEVPLRSSDYQVGQFKKLIEGRDYEIDDVLGYITLRQRLQENEALAVAFQYTGPSGTFKVGDFSSETGGGDNSQTSDRLVLKLLRPTNLQQPANLGLPNAFNPAAWYLEMRNIYHLKSRGINLEDFELEVTFEPPGSTPQKTIPGLGTQQTLIQLLGLDRLNEDGSPRPDNRFDKLQNITIDPSNGLLIFPYLEPFGDRMESVIAEAEQAGRITAEEAAELRQALVFSDLYTKKKENAQRNSLVDVFRIQGSYSSSVQAFYDLGAYSGLVPGSVRVTSGGATLTENVDYIVDYQGGTVTITNPSYLTPGRSVQIDWEQNALINLQQKTLLGARLDYTMDDRLQFGSTLMRLSEKSLTDKFRIGEEPIANTIWGIDGALDLQPRWLTRAVDALPFVQTKAPSSIRVTGEFAQLLPGHTQTNAFEDTRRDLRSDGRDFNSDELEGISYLDDFESFESILSLMRPDAWQLSAPPLVGADSVQGFEQSYTPSRRATFSWYQINQQTLALMGLTQAPPSVIPISPQEIFPERQISSQERYLTTLDVYYNPHERGPYNYTKDLPGFLARPDSAWGGMTQAIAEGYKDFGLKNIEFVEFIFKPFPEGGTDADPNARLYVDLGRISEDVIPDGQRNTEDGLNVNDVGSRFSTYGDGLKARLPSLPPDQVYNPIKGQGRTEDVGLDGLASFPGNAFEGTDGSEHQQFTDFLNALETTTSASPYFEREKAKALFDPSGDDYHFFTSEYFEDPRFYPDGASIQQRFSRFFTGTELNSVEAQTKLYSFGGGRGNSSIPDNEDLNLNSAPDTEDSYFQYEVPLNLAQLNELAHPERSDDYVVEEVNNGWYLVRIPVEQFDRRVGDIQDFSQIESIRVWTTGHTKPITLRFASFELVGSQWRPSDAVTEERGAPADTLLSETVLRVESINNEESNVYAVPQGTVISKIRFAVGDQRDAREQAMVLRVENLMPGQQRAVFQTYRDPWDLLKYKHLRMFVHLHGRTALGELQEEDREKVRLFVRLGANESNDYYEYEQPLTPSPLEQALSLSGAAKSDYLWRTNETVDGQAGIDVNSLHIALGLLNQLKFQRDELRVDPDTIFWNDEYGLEDLVAGTAPPGTRIGVKGDPSLNRVNTIVIGVRNPADSTSVSGTDILEEVTLWVNELRVSGYDERSGTAALVNADVQLADLARVRANVSMQNDGFGALSSTLADREQTNVRDWAFQADVNMDKFLPARYGWSIPVSVQVKSSTTTPRFDPNRGDVRVQDLIEAVENSPDATEEAIETRKQEIIEAAQNYSRTRSFTSRLTKSGSRSRVLRNTVDALSFNYSFTDSDGRSPSLTLNNSWNWSTALSYRVSAKARVVRPFGFLGGVPVVGVLGGLRFNYVPSSLSLSGNANRRYSETQERATAERLLSTDQPLEVAFPLRPQHAFRHDRQFSLQYNPFNFLGLTFDTSTNQSLNAAGVDTLFSVIRVDSLGNEELIPDLTLDQAIADSIVVTEHGDTGYELRNLNVIPTHRVVSRLFSGVVDPRTERYQSRLNLSFRPRIDRIKALDWISMQDVTYSAQFGWNNGAANTSTGATVSSRIEIRGGVSLRPQTLFQKFGFYRTLEEQQRAAEQERQRRREERRRARQEKEETEKTDTQAEEENGEGEEKEQVEERKGLKVPLPNPVSLLRRTALAVTGIRDIQVTYGGSRAAQATNVGRMDPNTGDVDVHYSLLDALQGHGPSLGYRFGLDRRIGLEDRILNTGLQVTDALTASDRVQARTTLTPSRSLSINLTWSLEQGTRDNTTYRTQEDGSILPVRTEGGENRASVWAFRASYLDLISRQIDALRADAAGHALGDTLQSSVLTSESVRDDFLAAYLQGFGTVDGRGLLPFPMPGWRIDYSGISNWPLVRWLTRSATIRHGYNADFSTSFNTLPPAEDVTTFALKEGGSTPLYFIQHQTESLRADAVRINERWQPLVGLDLSLRGNVSTNLAWNKANTYSLSTTNKIVSEIKTIELTLTTSYQKQGLSLPFLPGKRLNNRISFSLTLSRAVNDDRTFYMPRVIVASVSNPDFALSDALEAPSEFVSISTSTVRLTVAPKISYQFSNKVAADFFLRYERFESSTGVPPSMTNMNGGFNIRVTIQN